MRRFIFTNLTNLSERPSLPMHENENFHPSSATPSPQRYCVC